MSDITYVSDYLNQGMSPQQAFQAAIDHVYNTAGGGHVLAPPGNFVTPGLVMKGGVLLHGSGRGYGSTLLMSGANPYDRSSDAPIFTFDPSWHCDRGGLFDLQLQGCQVPGRQTNNLINIGLNLRLDFERVWADGGDTCLYNNGCDCRIFNCLFSSKGFACLTTNGANWYIMTSFDAPPNGPMHGVYIGSPNGICQQAGAMENFFDQCDFSGGYSSDAFFVHDADTHIAFVNVNNCVISGAVSIGSARIAQFGGGTRFAGGGVPFSVGNASVSVAGCQAINSLVLPPNVARAGNINISGGYAS